MSPATLAIIVMSFLVATEGNTTQWKKETGCSNSTCSDTWFIPKMLDNGSTACECGSDLGYLISCDQLSRHVELFQYYCMTYNNDNVSLVVGRCFSSQRGSHIGKYPRYDLPSDPSLLDNNCRKYGRTGQLCGKCQEGYAPPVYSYNLSCVNCTNYAYGWMKYGAAAFLPLTMFCLVVILFRISVTSGVLDVFILFSHMISLPAYIRLLVSTYHQSSHSRLPVSLFLSLHGIWNLDFFRIMYSPFCIHPKVTTLQALALDYVIAVYPLLMVVTTYLLVKLHDNFRLIMWLWKPFHFCFVRFRREWNIKSSLIDAFSTFLLLSYVKFLSVSLDLLLPVHVFDAQRETSEYLLYDGSVKYFGPTHFPFGVLALAVVLTFNILPLLLLCLYPCQCFQRCLDHCRIQFLKLHMFMDVFQGCYKNGTAGTCDCRWFAALYMTMRIALLVVVSTFSFNVLGLPIIVMLLQVLIFLITVFRPYKTPIHNTINIFLLIVINLLCVSLLADGTSHQYTRAAKHFTTLFCITPLSFFIGLLLYKEFGHRRCTQQAYRKIRSFMPCVACRRVGSEEFLPDRLNYAEQYTAILAKPDTYGTIYEQNTAQDDINS